MLPHDLKEYRQDAFVIFTPEECVIILGVVLAGALLLDALQRWAA